MSDTSQKDSVMILKTRQVIATGPVQMQVKQRCREWNCKATVEAWASWTTAWYGVPDRKAVTA